LSEKQEYLRKLSAVDEVLTLPEIAELLEIHPRGLVVDAVRTIINELRETILSLEDPSQLEGLKLEAEDLIPLVKKLVQEVTTFSQRRVINATGVIVHTNLGRSILPQEAVEAMAMAARSYTNLEYDLSQGQRGSRQAHITGLLTTLTGSEAALVVNNNAAAVLLVLSALAQDREVVVSRGELVEIGGGFRIPEIMRQSGARLVEVGTTNKTRVEDYRKAITSETALLLKVHTSNFKIVGFAQEVSLQELVGLAREFGLPVMYDLGSGVLTQLDVRGFEQEPQVKDCVKAGADIVTFSGDKLLGGPQAGVILGRKDLVERVKEHSLARAVRIDKISLAALEAVLRLYFDLTRAVQEIPTLAMICRPYEELKAEAEALKEILTHEVGQKIAFSVEDEVSRVGGGALPLLELKTAALALFPKDMSAPEMERRLRLSHPPVIARIKEDRILIDFRTLLPPDRDDLVKVIKEISFGD